MEGIEFALGPPPRLAGLSLPLILLTLPLNRNRRHFEPILRNLRNKNV